MATLAAPRLLVAAEAHPVADEAQVQMAPGLTISLFAREPDIVDPVALAFDEFGDAYVVEMRDYPYGFGADRKPGGTIRLLRDRDGDGRPDTATLFAEGLSFPTSVAPWNGGVLVTAPPDVLFLKDTDGDGRADVREVVLTGFRLSVTDSNANGLRWGLDNRVHVGNGGNGGNLRSPKQPNAAAVRLGQRDLRLDPATGRFELTTDTGGGFGLVFDDWGRSFVPYNIDHIQQRVANTDLFAGLAGYPAFSTTHSISDHGEMARIFPVSVAQTRPNHPEQAGHFSAAGGMGYLGHLGWPGDLPGSLFVGDVVGNLFHRDVPRPAGTILRATRAPGEQDREFFAARDGAFRPVGLELGPDGALYLVDMQRDVIEHPDYIPARMLAKLDLRAGEDRGRIYRLAPTNWPSNRELPGRTDVAGRVRQLASSNQWVRVTAQRLLVGGRETAAVPALKAMARARGGGEGSGTGSSSPTADALGRVHALWTLDGLGALDEAMWMAAFDDPHPGVRENAVALAMERRPLSGESRRRIEERLGDPEATVRFRAALALVGTAEPPIPALAAFLVRDAGDAWARRAGLAAAGGRLSELREAVMSRLAAGGSSEESGTPLLRELAAVAGGAGEVEAARLLDVVARPDLTRGWRIALLEGLADGAERAGKTFGPANDGLKVRAAELSTWAGAEPAKDRPFLAALWRVLRLWKLGEGPMLAQAMAQAAADARQATAPPATRREAVRLLALGSFQDVAPTLSQLLSGVNPAELQQDAFAALKGFRGHEAEIGPLLVRAWPSLAPGLRSTVVNALVYVPGLHVSLLDALEAGTLQVGELNLDLEHRRQLLRKAAPAIRTRAAKFMSDEEYSNRKTIVEEWIGKLPARGEASNGRATFERVCAQCHRAGGMGFEVGPELTGMSHRSVEDLLSNILDPSMALNPAFTAYTAELTDGESESGILAGETATGITLAQAGGRRVDLPRNRIRELRSSGRSLMPDGLEAGLTPKDLRDLIAFLQESGGEGKVGR